ncbi:hypothetical protein AKJ57_02660 [candidate division MSBL1 archaeon SCGC-AAA259A05]|uniref:CARDB domain-containing protein n=1 Tax=candidate division MSBL1 archaeon SCGC-AAA259A05 TaxID=1698259 RepID=A0A133U9Y9_9EURY|nr:hypothetical protein AKJ57_02660 [candidate division MSBL1 archaeon SCGC-AAA259A05]
METVIEKASNQRRKGISTITLIAIIVVAVVSVGVFAYVYARPQPKFQVEDLSLSSDKISKGDTVTAQVEVTNTGDARGTHTVKLEIEGETLEKEVTLNAGESRTVSFDIEKQEKGTYNLNIEDLSETFEVLEPAEFEVSDLTVNPDEVGPGESVNVSINLRNVGEVEGTHTVKLKVDGTVENTKIISLAGEESTNVSFTVRKETSGSFTVEIGDLSDSFKVKESGKVPTFQVGDHWTIKLSDENNYEFSYEITGKDELDNRACYVANISIEPPLKGLVENARAWISRRTMLPLRMQMGIFTFTYSYKYPDENRWPLFVGKEYTVIRTERRPSGEKEKKAFTVSVEKRENVAVPAGTFSAFKVVERNENGNRVETRWYSKRAKMNVKTIDHESGEVQELLTSSTGEVKAEGAKFEVSNLEISPKKPQSEEPITITLSATNIGDVWGTRKLNLKIDGEVEKTKYVSLEAGESTSVLFKAKRSRPKTYSVEVDGVSGSFEVGGAKEFKLQNFVFASQKPEGYMDYTEQPDATYSADDKIWIYVNVKGAKYNENPDGTKEAWVAASLKVEDPNGDVIVDQEVINDHRNWSEEKEMSKLFYSVYVTLPSGAATGEYTVTLTGTDKLANKTDTISSNFTVE